MKTRMYLIIMVVGILIYPSAAVLAADYTATFNNLNQIQIANPHPTPPQQDDISFDILNSTGQTWTDFHMSVFGALGAGFIPDNTPLFNNGSTYTGPGTSALSGPFIAIGGLPGTFPTQIDISGLNIPNAGHYDFNVDIVFGEQGWVLSGNPTTGGQSSVPEPATLLLVGSGLLGLWGARKKFKK